MNVRTSMRNSNLREAVALACLLALGAGCNKPDSASNNSGTATNSQTQVSEQQTPVTQPESAPVPVTQTQPDQSVQTPGSQQVSQTNQVGTQPEVQKVPVQGVVTKKHKQPVGGERAVSQAVPVQSVQQTEVTVAAGTTVSGTLVSGVSSAESHVGDKVSLQVDVAVRANDHTVFPVGSSVQGTVAEVQAAGRVRGASSITLQFTQVVLPNGKSVPVSCEPVTVKKGGDGKESAAEIGGGAAAGALLGRVIGGKHGTLKGAAAGAAVGTGVALAHKGDQVVLSAGQQITVTLTAPVVISGSPL